MTSISNTPQPEPIPPVQGGPSPSLWLYLALLVVSGGFVLAAFQMEHKMDWPAILLNLASDLIVTVIILVVIDRRLRSQELATLRRLPVITTQRFVSLLSPTRRLGQRYTCSLTVALEPVLVGKIELQGFAALEDKVRKGFVLLAGPGEGKTTWTQFAALTLSRKYIGYDAAGRVPILFSLARWLPDRSLHEALHESFAAYAPCGRWLFNRLLKSGTVVILLDGYDELWKRDLPFIDQLKALRAEFPTVAWTLISRSDKPAPPDLGECDRLAPPTQEELRIIRRRLKTT